MGGVLRLCGMVALFRFVMRSLAVWLRLLVRLLGGFEKHGWWRRDKSGRRMVFCQRKPEWVLEEVIKLAALAAKGSGSRSIAILFNRRFAAARGVTVGKTFVSYTLKAHMAEVLRMRERFKRRVPRGMPANRVWGMDLTGKGDKGGEVYSIVGIVDHGTRRAVRLCVVARKCSWRLLGHLCFAIAECGKPKVLRTDNEVCFCSRRFRWGLRLLGIRHQRSDLGCPWQNGRVERFFLTLKQKLDAWVVADADMLGRALGDFSLWYNEVRPHQHLDGRTPDGSVAGD